MSEKFFYDHIVVIYRPLSHLYGGRTDIHIAITEDNVEGYLKGFVGGALTAEQPNPFLTRCGIAYAWLCWKRGECFPFVDNHHLLATMVAIEMGWWEEAVDLLKEPRRALDEARAKARTIHAFSHLIPKEIRKKLKERAGIVL